MFGMFRKLKQRIKTIGRNVVYNGIDQFYKANDRIKKPSVHLSIDDVSESLQMLHKCSTYAGGGGMFKSTLFARLKKYHDQYNAKFTLYCYAIKDKFLISEIPFSFRQEFKANKDWLKLGFHQKCDVPFLEEEGYAAGFELVERTVKCLHSGRTNTLRLHYWKANPEQKNFLRSKGVTTLLTEDDDRLPYNDDDFFISQGIVCRRTRVRFENLNEINPSTLAIGRKHIVAFTHEWCFADVTEKIEKALSLYREHGYKFIT
jgi:hypothetical protein